MMNRGFTLIELVLVIAIAGVLGSYIAPGLINGLKSFSLMTTRAHVLAQARSGMNRMVKEIRLIESSSKIQTANSSEFRFRYPGNTSNRYRLQNNKLRRGSRDLVDDVSALNFTYFDESGNTTNNKNNIRSVQISFTVDPPNNTPDIILRSRVFLRNLGNSYYGIYDLN